MNKPKRIGLKVVATMLIMAGCYLCGGKIGFGAGLIANGVIIIWFVNKNL